MINLKDQISHFKRMIYNRQLAQFISIDQQFSGEGLTMQSLISQNNFIVEQLKKMEAVMINYCKLNDKIYNKIMEHQLNLHAQNSKLVSLISSMERKLEEHQKRSEDLHSKTVSQTNLIKNILTATLDPIKQQVQKKVDKDHFQSKIKKILEDYDEGALEMQEKEVSQNGQGHTQLNNPLETPGIASQPTNTIMVPTIRKKGKVGYDQYYSLLQKLQQKQKHQKIQKQQLKDQIKQNKDTIHRYIPTINKTMLQISQINAQLHNLQQKIKNVQDYSNLKIISLKKQFENKTNDKIWAEKLQIFYNMAIKDKIQSINNTLQTRHTQLNNYKRQNNKLFQWTKTKASQHQLQIQQLTSSQQITKTNISTININIQSNYSIFQKNRQQVSALIKDNYSKHKNHMELIQKQMNKQIVQIKESIKNLSKEAEENIMRNVSKKIQVQIKEIQVNIRLNGQKLDNLRYDLGIACCQMKNIKDVVSKKANYADFIVNLENKVNREDLIEIQKNYENQQHLLSKELLKLHQSQRQIYRSQKSSLNQSKVTRPMSTRRVPTSKSRPGKAVFLSYSINKQLQKQQQDNIVAKQVQHPVQAIIQKRKIYSQISKRAMKNVKLDNPTVTVAEFLL